MDDSEMFMNFYDPRRDSPFYGMMASLIFTHKDQFYQALYEAVSKHPSYVVLSDLESEKKLKVLDGMIQYYEAKESYEKCATLLNIKKEIEEYVEN
jgi:hypothetical protein